MIVADTGAVVGLIDAGDRHHATLRALFESDPGAWILPWAILPEVDHIVRSHLGVDAARAFVSDLVSGAFQVEWGSPDDLRRARELCGTYRDLDPGLVDGVVIAVAERLEAEAIATLDLRDFGAIDIRGAPRFLPRDS